MIRLALLALMLASSAHAAPEPAPAKKAPAETPGAAPAPYPLLPPEQVNAFPPEIMERMRAALVALEQARDGQ
ncbi:hypothetical protein [Limimaricola cinnabarinus]|uniref:hypothetical protein n=1 Tax=Limimaricola cinnabarinus TaxID=1125964 RepID=UPI0024930F0E|nr:hypothetical protein [Limimaricola cinnabarinus]